MDRLESRLLAGKVIRDVRRVHAGRRLDLYYDEESQSILYRVHASGANPLGYDVGLVMVPASGTYEATMDAVLQAVGPRAFVPCQGKKHEAV